jgi:hypothetical protein
MYEYGVSQLEKKFENSAAIFSLKAVGRGIEPIPNSQIGTVQEAVPLSLLFPDFSTDTTSILLENTLPKNLRVEYTTPTVQETAEIPTWQRYTGVVDPATELSTQESNENRVADIIRNIRDTKSIPDREVVAQRLFELLEDVKEEDQASIGISLKSLLNFYSFLQVYGYYLKKPSIGLTPTNEIYASWKERQLSVFSIHFLASGFVHFAIIAPSSIPRIEKKVCISGTVNPDTLLENVKPWGVLKWAGRERR